ncbi:MAG TPA: hypothetical protein VGR67_16360 [Candidatus Polarisedimenticolia bacterium]|nr:hypothetical protein [Candidatus Polarisedimenticolia bacterium]
MAKDGRPVVGSLQASVTPSGAPRSLTLLWTADGGLVTLNDLLATSGFVDPAAQ